MKNNNGRIYNDSFIIIMVEYNNFNKLYHLGFATHLHTFVTKYRVNPENFL